MSEFVMEVLGGDRRLGFEAHADRNRRAGMEGVSIGQDVGNDVDVGGRAAWRSSREVDVQRHHLSVDEDLRLWLEELSDSISCSLPRNETSGRYVDNSSR